MKRLFKYSFFSIFVILLGCAPRPLPPPTYSGIELTLKEVVSEAGEGIDAIKVVVDIDVERDNSPYHHSSASILIKRPNMVHMKMYNFGMLAGDVVVKGKDVHVLYGRISMKLESFIRELYDAVFWWDGAGNGNMYKEEDTYVIRTDNRQLYIDSATLLPIKQSLKIDESLLYITYDIPVNEGGLWYPSFIEIRMDKYRFLVKIERLLLNPQLKEDDLKPFGEVTPRTSIQG